MIKNKYFLFVAGLLLALIAPSASWATDAGSIVIKVTGLRNDKGTVRIALFNSKAAYTASKAGEQAFQKMKVPITDQKATATFEAVPYGEYAIKLFHDEDNSGRFITNMFGIPKVEYGFSNNAHGLMGPASFEKALFKLNSPNLEMPIKMQGN